MLSPEATHTGRSSRDRNHGPSRAGNRSPTMKIPIPGILVAMFLSALPVPLAGAPSHAQLQSALNSHRPSEFCGEEIKQLVNKPASPSALPEDPRESVLMLQYLARSGAISLPATSAKAASWGRHVPRPIALSRTFGMTSIIPRNKAENRKPPGMRFSSRNQNFLSAVDFAWWCNGTWRCWVNPDNSVTLSTHWNDRVSGWKSKMNFFYGVFSVEMKLPKVNSEGVWHTFYVIQPQDIPNSDPGHAEIDIEFLGSKDPKTIKIATNIIAGGYQNLEQHNLSFDPSKDFHRYTISWSPRRIVWLVDDTPIRMTWRTKGNPWPARPLQMLGTTWATQDKIDWSEGPMSVQYRNLAYQSCATWTEGPPLPPCSKMIGNRQHPWNNVLSPAQAKRMAAYRKKYLVNSWGWDKWK